VKDIHQVIWQKEIDIARVRMEIEALRFSISLLSEEGDDGHRLDQDNPSSHAFPPESVHQDGSQEPAQGFRQTAS